MPEIIPSIMLDTPIGRLGITERDGKIVQVAWVASAGGSPQGAPTPLLDEAKRQMAAYFAGELKEFDLPLDPGGNALERGVFDAMSAIPYGQIRTYGDIANDLGTYGQPVGQACGANPIPVIIPCHRVLSATGLGGLFRGGRCRDQDHVVEAGGGLSVAAVVRSGRQFARQSRSIIRPAS